MIKVPESFVSVRRCSKDGLYCSSGDGSQPVDARSGGEPRPGAPGGHVGISLRSAVECAASSTSKASPGSPHS